MLVLEADPCTTGGLVSGVASSSSGEWELVLPAVPGYISNTNTKHSSLTELMNETEEEDYHEGVVSMVFTS